MFKKESNSIRYTAEDIERYHRGLLSGAERHALERAALEDPLLEEALEGYAGLSPNQAARDLSILRDRLAERVRGSSRRVLAASWWKAAAVLIVLAGAGALAYEHWWSGGPEKALAKREVPRATAAGTPGATGTATVAAAAADSAAVAAKEHATPAAPVAADSMAIAISPAESRLAATTSAQPPALATIPPAAPQINPQTRIVIRGLAPKPDTMEYLLKHMPGVQVDSLTGNGAGSVAGTLAGSVAGVDLRDVAVRENKQKQMLQKMDVAYFKNRVTDANNQPITGATVQILPAGNYLVTDRNGYFHFNAADSQARVVVTAVGYTPRQYYAYQLNALPSVQLLEDTSNLNKVVVIGYGRAKVDAKLANGPYHATTDTTSAQPIDGWSSYNDYLSSNLQLPDQVVVNHIHGEVDLSFQVDETGKPVNISVVKSLCDSCDAEAIRLLQQGPGWKKGAKAKGRLKVHF